MAADGPYKFKIDEEKHQSDEKILTGKELRAFPPGVPDGVDLYMKLGGKPGKLIGNDDKVDLSEPGLEKFYTQDASSEAG